MNDIYLIKTDNYKYNDVISDYKPQVTRLQLMHLNVAATRRIQCDIIQINNPLKWLIIFHGGLCEKIVDLSSPG